MNVLIVDDDRMAVDCTASMVDWDILGIEGVYRAYSKSQAVAVIEKMPVDILLCDIEMPRGNGYDLLDWIEENGYKIVTIFITSHAKFEYISKAMKMKVVDYILKPIPREDLEKAVKNAVEMVEKERKRETDEKYASYWNSWKNVLVREFWKDILEDGWTEPHYLREKAQKAGVCLRRGKSHYPILLHYSVEKQEEAAWNDKILGFSIGNICAEFLFGRTDSGNILPPEDGKLLIVYETFRETDAMLADKCRYLMRQLKRFLNFCNFSIYVKEKAELENLADTVRELDDFLSGQLYFRSEVYVVDEREESWSEGDLGAVVELVKEYLKANKAREASRNEIARAVHLHPDYLSRVFKAGTGMSITNYLLELRMKEAKKLLLNSRLSITDVALTVGYQDTSYFTRQFKRKCGISPRGYRKNAGWRDGNEK